MMNRILILLLSLMGYFCPIPVVAGQPAIEGFSKSVSIAVQSGNINQVSQICKDWYASELIPGSVLNWNYNTLMSLEKNGLLIVQKDAESYVLWVLQEANKTRTDVAVLSWESLGKPDYKDFIFKKDNIVLKGDDPQAVLGNLLKNNNVRPVYLGVMMDKPLVEQVKNNLYVTGLALKFSEKPFESLAVLRQHYENDFRLDYLRQDYNPESELKGIANMNLNYLPAFLILYKYYSSIGNADAANDLRAMSLRIAKDGEKEAEVKTFFVQQPTVEPGSVSVKNIDRRMRKAGKDIWASEVETTNEQYELFLLDLLKKKDYTLLNICKSEKTNWRELLPDSLKILTDAVVFKNGHPDDGNMPVQQISYEAAQHYCAWLTSSYNASTEKKKYKKVLFRLPTEEEWMTAAVCGRSKGTPYPWGGYFMQNSKGCYLLNLNVTRPCRGCDDPLGSQDGAYFTTPANSYFPNDFGLYNMSGNVSEMIQEKGKAKGGSWMEDGFHAQISAVSSYTKPGPNIGFRVFMEVIEQ